MRRVSRRAVAQQCFVNVAARLQVSPFCISVSSTRRTVTLTRSAIPMQRSSVANRRERQVLCSYRFAPRGPRSSSRATWNEATGARAEWLLSGSNRGCEETLHSVSETFFGARGKSVVRRGRRFSEVSRFFGVAELRSVRRITGFAQRIGDELCGFFVAIEGLSRRVTGRRVDVSGKCAARSGAGRRGPGTSITKGRSRIA